MPADFEFILSLFFVSQYAIPGLIFLTMFFFGIKLHYSIRVSCGNFIDKKYAIEQFIGFMLLGISLGIAISSAMYYFGVPLIYIAPLVLVILPSTFLMNLTYNPAPLYAREDEDDRVREIDAPAGKRPEETSFAYLNFTYVIVYTTLGFASISKYYGNLIHVEMVFIALFFLIFLGGYIAGRYLRLSRLHIYGQSFLPLLFLVFLILLMSFSGRLTYTGSILLFSPMILLMGIVIRHTIRFIITEGENNKRATIIEFAFLILPAPIIISISLIQFTNFLFYAAVCVLMLLNVIVPAIYMVNSDIKGFKKAMFFIISLFFLPLFIFIVAYFRISLDGSVYVTRVANFDELKNINYNADYIRGRATIRLKGLPVFKLSDSVVRNQKRSLLPVAFYHGAENKILFIDGYQRFFRNPIIGYFRYSACLDVLSERDADYKKLPISGSQRYIPDSGDLLYYLARHDTDYSTIVDIPNLLDQTMNSFRFSSEYYRLIKKRLDTGGIFCQAINIPGVSADLFAFAVQNLRSSFKKQIVFYFSNVMIVLASDDVQAFVVNQERYGRFLKFIAAHDEVLKLFQNDVHLLSHLLYTGIDDLIPFTRRGASVDGIFFSPGGKLSLAEKLYDTYISGNQKVFELLDKSPEQYAFAQGFMSPFLTENAVLSLLKKTELAEARGKLSEETGLLFELKKQAEFRATLQDYVRLMMSYKEKYYYNMALMFEKNKKWEEARELYLSVLAIRPDNFEANYRLGLLCITLQDIESSFKYLQEAMRIRKENPKVLFQMGVLYFSTGKTEEAMNYFNRVLQLNDKTPSVFRYLGLCYEKFGNLYEAERYYARAIIADPNDVDTKARLDEVRMQIEKENRKWETPEQKNELDVEQDADMPLPVSKGAYDIRLKDSEVTLPVIDQASGKDIQADMGGGDKDAGVQR
ncbi:MAG: tetratricopeptide repeat protein [Spirochaetes bacterium]|nr:tetratricopeptide repeat protein [Spirochaetota bacterium]